MKRVVLTLAIGLAPCLVFGQDNSYKEQVFLDTFDKASHTYSGRIIVAFKTCVAVPDQIFTYNELATVILFRNAKDAEEAKAQTKAEVDRIISNAAKVSKLCKIE
jgi:hypothetical protein